MNQAVERWSQLARNLKKETFAVYLAARDPRVPWYAKLLAVCVVGYAFSPIDLIPDFIPVLGYVDDLVLVPVGIALVLKMIPEGVMAECREKAHAVMAQGKPTNWVAAGLIIAVWLLLAALSAVLVIRIARN
ncbi:MAG TPA: YkvA family protein [Pyrinomonadaceae bacterium]|nr:YkvA family protein [Pyrinomonadaceae bacterium]